MGYLGQSIKKLGFGLMRLPQLEGGAIDVEQTKEMVDLFLDAGFTYFDTAWAYAGSEDAIRQALVERYPREKFQLATNQTCRFLFPFHTGRTGCNSECTSGNGICTASD